MSGTAERQEMRTFVPVSSSLERCEWPSRFVECLCVPAVPVTTSQPSAKDGWPLPELELPLRGEIAAGDALLSGFPCEVKSLRGAKRQWPDRPLGHYPNAPREKWGRQAYGSRVQGVF